MSNLAARLREQVAMYKAMRAVVCVYNWPTGGSWTLTCRSFQTFFWALIRCGEAWRTTMGWGSVLDTWCWSVADTNAFFG